MDGRVPCHKLLGPGMFKLEEAIRITCHAPLFYKRKSEAQRRQGTYQSLWEGENSGT